MGYGINEDDNHLNAYLHNFTNEHKILIVTDEDESVALQKYKSRLRLENDNLHICTVDYSEKKEIIVEKIFKCLD